MAPYLWIPPQISPPPSAMLLLALCLVTPVQTQHVVDISGTTGHPSIQSAVDAAQEGDTVLVLRPADPDAFVPGFDLVGKGLIIRGVGDFPVPVGPSTIRAVPESSEVVLDSLGFHQSTWTHPSAPAVTMTRRQLDLNQPGLLLETVLCPVRIQSSWIEGSTGNVGRSGGDGEPGLDLDLATNVTLIDTTVFGGLGITGPGGIGLVATRSRVASYGSQIRGGHGAVGPNMFSGDPLSQDGGAALSLTNRSFLWLGDSSLIGGSSHDAHCYYYHCVSQVGDGGDVGNVGASSFLCVLESSLQPGRGGHATGGINQPSFGDDGDDLTALGLYVEVPGTQRRLYAPAERPSGQDLPISIEGTPGEPVYVSMGSETGHRFLGPLFGIFGIRVPHGPGFFHVGTIPGSGVLHTSVPLPPVGSVAPEVVYVQALLGLLPAPNFTPRFRLSEVRSVTVTP